MIETSTRPNGKIDVKVDGRRIATFDKQGRHIAGRDLTEVEKSEAGL